MQEFELNCCIKKLFKERIFIIVYFYFRECDVRAIATNVWIWRIWR